MAYQNCLAQWPDVLNHFKFSANCFHAQQNLLFTAP